MSEAPLHGWHIDKRVSVGHIVTTVVVAATAMWWLSDVQKSTELNKQKIEFLAETLKDDRNEIKDTLREITQQLRAIRAELAKKQDR